MSGQGEGDGFLSRWSRLKRQTEAPAAEEPLPAAPAVAEPEGEEPFDPEKLPIPLPSLDDLKPGDSLVAFMQKGVPELLRNAALRKMWALDPMVRDFKSEALDYAWDWNTPGGVPGTGPLGVEDKVEEMVEALFRTDEPGPAEDVSVTEMPGVPATSEHIAKEATRADKIQIEQSSLNHSEKMENTDADHEAPRRRHGGAMPQV